MLWVFILAAWQGNHLHSDQGARFLPISPGNVITIGNFSYEIPEGSVYVDAENVHHMFTLVGADNVPNCVGMFVSSSNTWDHSITVQHLPGQSISLEPKLASHQLEMMFSMKHFLTLKPVEPKQEASVVWPARHDPETHSFSFGMRYLEGEDQTPYYYIKKIWATGEDALVFTLKAKESAYLSEQEAIEAALNAVVPAAEAEPAASINDPAALSYLTLLGLTYTPKGDEAVAENQPMGENPAVEARSPTSLRTSLIISGGLLLIAGIALFFAVRMRRSQAQD